MNDEFYIGYRPNAPARVRRLVKRTVAALALGAVALAAVLVFAERRFAPSVFEFGKTRSFQGTIQLHPYPTLLVARPGEGEDTPTFSRYLLVAPGKHGSDKLVSQFDGMRVSLQGQLIYREANTMVEVVPGSVSAVGKGELISAPAAEDFGEATLTGEIVDTKCYFGVMNPSSGKVHSECAARCISGGVPVGFIVQDGKHAAVYLLTDSSGQPLNRRAMKFAAEPVTIQGRIIKLGDTLFLAGKSDWLQPLARGL